MHSESPSADLRNAQQILRGAIAVHLLDRPNAAIEMADYMMVIPLADLRAIDRRIADALVKLEGSPLDHQGSRRATL